MNLFCEKKNIFLKIMNGLFLIWLITALIILFANVINVLMPDPSLNYEEFKATNCHYMIKEANEEDDEEECLRQYDISKMNRRINLYHNTRNSLIALGNIIIIGSTMIFLNKKEK